MANFSGGVLDIPGLMPVNIGSSAPYPVPFAPQIRPQSAPVAPSNPSMGSGLSPGTSDGGSFSGIDQYTPTFGSTTADPMFVDFPGYANSTPDFFGYGNYAPEVSPAQLSGIGSIGLGGFGDRLSSLTNAPYLDDNNYAQGAVNAASWFAPIIAPLAGLAQGFNLWDGGETTTNAGVDLLATPGLAQRAGAWVGSELNQLLGGTPMGREHTSGSAYDVGGYGSSSGGWDASNDPGVQAVIDNASDPWMGWDPNVYFSLTGSTVPPSLTRLLNPDDPFQNSLMSQMTLNQVGGSGNGTSDGMPQQPSDPYSLTGNMWDNFMLGATFGGGRFDQPNSDPMFSPTNFFSPGFGAADRGLNPNDTN